MRRIIKHESPDFFENWKRQFKKQYGRDAEYNDFNCKEKQDLKQVLLDEQYGLCCYCMRKVTSSDGHIYGHIEHIRPQSKFAGESMSYDNMLISCNGAMPYVSKEDSCGHRKGDWFSEDYISPLEKGVERHFKYTIDGNILPSGRSDQRAEETIARLNLNSYGLRRKRKRAIHEALVGDSTYDEIIREYSTPIDGKLPEFCMAVIYCVREQQSSLEN